MDSGHLDVDIWIRGIPEEEYDEIIERIVDDIGNRGFRVDLGIAQDSEED